MIKTVKENGNIVDIPSWMSLTGTRFVGIPPLEDVDNKYEVEISASNEFKEVVSSFSIDLSDTAPELNENLRIADQSIHVGNELKIIIEENTFID